jgi:hypothetical protein
VKMTSWGCQKPWERRQIPCGRWVWKL